MSTLKPVEVLRQCVEYCRQQNGRPDCKNCGLNDVMIDDVLSDTVQVLCDLLEGEKIDANLINKEGWHRRNSQWIMGMNQATEQAQALIRQTLDPDNK